MAVVQRRRGGRAAHERERCGKLLRGAESCRRELKVRLDGVGAGGSRTGGVIGEGYVGKCLHLGPARRHGKRSVVRDRGHGSVGGVENARAWSRIGNFHCDRRVISGRRQRRDYWRGCRRGTGSVKHGVQAGDGGYVCGQSGAKRGRGRRSKAYLELAERSGGQRGRAVVGLREARAGLLERDSVVRQAVIAGVGQRDRLRGTLNAYRTCKVKARGQERRGGHADAGTGSEHLDGGRRCRRIGFQHEAAVIKLVGCGCKRDADCATGASGQRPGQVAGAAADAKGSADRGNA